MRLNWDYTLIVVPVNPELLVVNQDYLILPDVCEKKKTRQLPEKRCKTPMNNGSCLKISTVIIKKTGLGGFEPPTSGLEARRYVRAKPQAHLTPIRFAFRDN